jgi:hypothetical protein
MISVIRLIAHVLWLVSVTATSCLAEPRVVIEPTGMHVALRNLHWLLALIAYLLIKSVAHGLLLMLKRIVSIEALNLAKLILIALLAAWLLVRS